MRGDAQPWWETQHVEHPQLPLRIAVDASGALVCVQLDPSADDIEVRAERCEVRLREGEDLAAARQLSEYLRGERRRFDLSISPRGSPFDLRVWAALCEIPYGKTWTYGRQARHIGSEGAARAVGGANGRNPLPIVVPCHRVVGGDGSLTGFGGGLAAKRWLLELESSQASLGF